MCLKILKCKYVEKLNEKLKWKKLNEKIEWKIKWKKLNEKIEWKIKMKKIEWKIKWKIEWYCDDIRPTVVRNLYNNVLV